MRFQIKWLSIAALAILFLIAGQNRSAGQCRVERLANGDVYGTTVSDPTYTFDSARYTVYIPRGVDRIRGVFIHQHGCTMEGRGEATAYDVQYQAFAKRWGLAVVGPDLYSASGNCHKWRDPESGSAEALMRALDEVGSVSGHPELGAAPWLLWGHSGGGYWALGMLREYPHRTIAAFCYSPAFDPQWDYPAAAMKVPVIIRHAGKEGDECCWTTAINTFGRMRRSGGCVSIAYTPYQNHNYSFVRYMAIPFYEAVLEQRLPKESGRTLRDMDISRAWLGDTLSLNIRKAAGVGKKAAAAMCWLPDSLTAARWREYSITGTVADRTPPPPPHAPAMRVKSNRTVELTWCADADIESGIRHFNIYQGGLPVARFPASGEYQRFDTNGDDAFPVSTLSPLKLELTGIVVEAGPISISTVNHFSLESPQVEFQTIR